VLGASGEKSGAMIALMDRALALNPSFARGWFLQRPHEGILPVNHHDRRATTSRVGSDRSERRDALMVTGKMPHEAAQKPAAGEARLRANARSISAIIALIFSPSAPAQTRHSLGRSGRSSPTEGPLEPVR